MAQDKFKRKLTSIFSADVAGYSRLMGEDEAATVKTLEQYKGIMSELISQHHGRVVDSPGDNLLAEFTSVVDAVQCAVAIQKELQARNAELPENRRMQFRIGVNLGDVIEEESRIYGDGVNIAARLEALADPGGICVSKTAFDQIEAKLPFGYEFLGEQTVKKIDKPIGAYRVVMEPRVTISGKPEKDRASGFRRMPILTGVAAAVVLAVVVGIWQFYPKSLKEDSRSAERGASSLAEQPSIAVLPFANMSNDPEQEYFCDGIADQIINSIAKIPYIMVIARNSSFAYKGKSVNVQQIAGDLEVRYILEGSLQRDKENVRINTQLIDAQTGRHLWAENYDRKLDDIFSVQDEICKSIMLALQVKLTMGEMARMGADTVNIKAYEKYIKAREHYLRRTREDSLVARQLFQEAIALDPEYAMAYIDVGWTYLDDIWLGMTKTPSESIVKAEEMVQKAVSIRGFTAPENALLSSIHVLKKDWEKAIAYGEKAVEDSPNSAGVHTVLAYALRNNKQYDEAISSYKKALQLNPVKNMHRLDGLAYVYLFSKQYEKAISIWNEILERNPDYLFAYIGLTMAYWLTGSEEQARQAARQVLRINPKFSVDYIEEQSALKDKQLKDQLFAALRKAGLK